MPLIDYLPEWAKQELSELRKAPVGAGILFVLGVMAGGGAMMFLGARELANRQSEIDLLTRQRDDAVSKAEKVSGTAASSSTFSLAGDGVLKWSGGDFRPCFVEVDGLALRDFQEKFNIALICGLTRTNIDRLTDVAISKSGLFSIDSRPYEIQAPLSQKYLDAVLSFVKAVPKEMIAPPGGTIVLSMVIWYELVLLPKGVSIDNVSALEDVTRFGGRRHSSRGFNAQIPLDQLKKLDRERVKS